MIADINLRIEMTFLTAPEDSQRQTRVGASVRLDYAREKKHNVVVKKADQGDPQLGGNAAFGMSLVPGKIVFQALY
jgi:hypothetical protein